MHPLLHHSFKDHLETEHGTDRYHQVLATANIDVEQFEATDGYHDDAIMAAAIEIAADLDNTSAFDFQTNWGQKSAPGLFAAFKEATEPSWELLDYLEHIEQRMHPHVRQGGAQPAVLDTERVSKTELTISAATDRGYTGLAKGFVLGFADVYQTPVSVEVDDKPNGFTFRITTINP